LGLLFSLLSLSACAVTAPPPAVSPQIASTWQAPLQAAATELPHGGTAQDLGNWWAAQGDSALAQLVREAQAASPSVASAAARIAQARALRTAADADGSPALDAAGSLSRSRSQQPGAPSQPIVGSGQIGLQAAWEIDLFGGNRASRSAAAERLAGAQAQWHDARVSVAAEVASHYYALRTCRQLEAVTRADATSRAETARLAELSRDAGFTAPATAALARASAAEASARATQQRSRCVLDTKALVALTAMDEPTLRDLLGNAGPAALPRSLVVSSVPAELLAQRPDVFAAEREVAAASADVGAANASRFPRLSLQGSVGRSALRLNGDTSELSTWSVGPLAISVPLFDGGRRRANIEAAQARYVEAAALYRAQARNAVREVEQALVSLAATAERTRDVQTSVAGFQASFNGTEARYRSGLASLVELEDARRQLLAAQTAEVSLQLERLNAWVALYRALGGGWTATANTPMAPIAPAAAATGG
jgi:NodT family efflux transporter outer membrane factor (OMF) lipoprotein